MQKILLILVTFIATFNAQACVVSWDRPIARENGDPLPLTELGGYEIRGFDVNGNKKTSALLESNTITSYSVCQMQEAGAKTFRIAAFDTSGLYSEFVDVVPKLSPPGDLKLEAPKDLRLE